MARTAKKPTEFDTGSPTDMPPYGTRAQLAALYTRVYGPPMAAKTLEKWPLTWRMMNGRAAAPVKEFLAEAERRLKTSAAIRGGRVVQQDEQPVGA